MNPILWTLSAIALCLFVIVEMKNAIAPASRRKRSVALVVLGDIARSPRMMYHTQSLLRHEFSTTIVGYGDSELPDSLKDHTVLITPFPVFLNRLPFLLLAPLKVLWQFSSLLLSLSLRMKNSPQYILVQVRNVYRAE